MSDRVLDTVSREHRSRGDVGRFRTLPEMLADATAQRARCAEHEATGPNAFFVEGEGGLGLDLGGGVSVAGMTSWAARQVGSIAGVPGGLVERLRPATAARVLNETWPRTGPDAGPRRFLVDALPSTDGGPATPILRAVVTPTYRRLWDADLLGEVSRWLAPSGWAPAYPTINHGGQPEADRPRALWRTDRDSFAFFMSTAGTADGGEHGGMRRGLYVGNSEVGASSLNWGTFWFRDVCANFLVWGAEDVSERRRRHTAGIVHEFRDLRSWIRNAVPAATPHEADVFRRLDRLPFEVPAPTVARSTETWEDRFAKSVADRFGVTQALARKAAPVAAAGDAGARAGSWWAAVNGITAAARDLDPSDRFDASRAAGRMVSAGLVLAGS